MSSELSVERPTNLPLPEPQEERRVHFGNVSRCFIGDGKRQNSTSCSRDTEFRPKRMRSASFSAGEFRHGYKRRKRYRVLPSKFLLGGNITDPLNLGSLEDREEVSQLSIIETSAVINKKSDAVRVLIPPNINDPLNLDVSSDNEDSFADALQRQLRKRRRNRKRKRRLSEPSGDSIEIEPQPLHSVSLEECQIAPDNEDPAEKSNVSQVLPKISAEALKPLTVNTELPTPTPAAAPDDQKESSGQITPVGAKPSTSGFQRPLFKKQRNKSDNKIVSPVIPQPGVERKRHPSSRQFSEKPYLSQQNLKLPKKFNPKNELFQYGNYNKYYGYRNPDMSTDVRLNYLKPEWFEGREVLDVGCNIGHITLTIARDFGPKRVVGIDIDKKLVNIAQKNIKHYRKVGDVQETNFPKSMRLLYGPLKPPVPLDGVRCFPHNIKFVHANYVLESDELLETVKPEFDVIMCFSISKWIHLNWGDAGLKRFFRRIFYNLNPGGRFILEPQGWPSYNKRRKLTLRIFENYKGIRLFPDKFNDYLLHEVGFSTSEKIITPQHTSKGFQRPIIVYTKAGIPSKAISLDGKSIRNSSTKSTTSDQSHSTDSKTGEVRAQANDKSGNNDAENAKNLLLAKTDGSNPKDSAQGQDYSEKCATTIQTDANATSSNVHQDAMNCESSSDWGHESIDKGQEKACRMESDSLVCDISNTQKTPVGGGGHATSTHSVNSKPDSSVSESQLPTPSRSSEACMIDEVFEAEKDLKSVTDDIECDTSLPDEKEGSGNTVQRTTTASTLETTVSSSESVACTSETKEEVSKVVVDSTDSTVHEGPAPSNTENANNASERQK